MLRLLYVFSFISLLTVACTKTDSSVNVTRQLNGHYLGAFISNTGDIETGYRVKVTPTGDRTVLIETAEDDLVFDAFEVYLSSPAGSELRSGLQESGNYSGDDYQTVSFNLKEPIVLKITTDDPSEGISFEGAQE